MPVHRFQCGYARAFTLLETILALTVLAMLTAVTAMAVSGFQSRQKLDTGMAMFQALLRTVRVEAADRGCAMRLDVDAEGRVAVAWEPQPFEQPGVFQPYTAGPVRRIVDSLDVRISQMTVAGAEATTLAFHPDGSSDDAVVTLVSTDDSDPREAVIELDGLFGNTFGRIGLPGERSED